MGRGNDMKNKGRKITLLISSLFLISVTGFVIKNTTMVNKSKSDRIEIHRDYPYSEELTDMISNSSYIVKGQFTGYDHSWNMARNPDNIQEEDKTNYVEGRLYNFKVEKIFKNEDDILDEIKVNFMHSRTETLVEADERITLKDSLYKEPELEQEYVLFLLKDKDFHNYYAATEPFLVKIEKGSVSLQSNLLQDDNENIQTFKLKDNSVLDVVEEIPHINDFLTGMSYREFERIMNERNK